jgi:hypothetical protein
MEKYSKGDLIKLWATLRQAPDLLENIGPVWNILTGINALAYLTVI